jgi:hypothetical protein
LDLLLLLLLFPWAIAPVAVTHAAAAAKANFDKMRLSFIAVSSLCSPVWTLRLQGADTPGSQTLRGRRRTQTGFERTGGLENALCDRRLRNVIEI